MKICKTPAVASANGGKISKIGACGGPVLASDGRGPAAENNARASCASGGRMLRRIREDGDMIMGETDECPPGEQTARNGCEDNENESEEEQGDSEDVDDEEDEFRGRILYSHKFLGTQGDGNDSLVVLPNKKESTKMKQHPMKRKVDKLTDAAAAGKLKPLDLRVLYCKKDVGGAADAEVGGAACVLGVGVPRQRGDGGADGVEKKIAASGSGSALGGVTSARSVFIETPVVLDEQRAAETAESEKDDPVPPVNADEAPKPRKRGRPPKNKESEHTEAGEKEVSDEPPKKRPRGRPPKPKAENDLNYAVPKKRGRPRKERVQEDDDGAPPKKRGRPPKAKNDVKKKMLEIQ
mmetsp:Transcript_13949/g.34455  ORF Transcript_13949/g.34455 Transcript_13949/m.34455 type:complete len:352 (-) Transcript_13949:1476-2531(-)